MTIELEGGGYQLRLDASHGAHILSAFWTGSDGAAVPLLASLCESSASFKFGCFAMLPFANRIDRGCFTFQNRLIQFPINLAEEDMACHGFARDNPWQVMRQESDSALLAQDFASRGNSYRYHAEQELHLSEGGVRITLSVRNDGPDAFPFGIGLHPWFPKTPLTTLSFEAEGKFLRDDRGLPIAPLVNEPYFVPGNPTPLGSLAWFDGCFAGWQPRCALLAWPEIDTALHIEAGGALRHLHVFVPDDRAVACAEPVSHLPDAINRPELGSSGAMDVLEPGATLAGSMNLRALSYPLP